MLKIYEEISKDENVIFLKLVPSKAFKGFIDLVVVDEDGDTESCGNLLTIKNDGSIYKHIRIDQDFGFDLTIDGKLKDASTLDEVKKEEKTESVKGKDECGFCGRVHQ